MQNLSLDDIEGVEEAPFPAPRKSAAGLVNETPTDVSSIFFADKIMITISQGGRLSQWIQVPLSTSSPTSFETALPQDSDMLPLSHLTPKVLLGAGGEKRESVGLLLASQIASLIATKDPTERRTVILGMGLVDLSIDGYGDEGRNSFFDLLELVGKVA